MNKTFIITLGIIIIATAGLAENLRICKATKLDENCDWESVCFKLLKQENKERDFLLNGGSLIQEQTEYNKLASEQTEFVAGQNGHNLYIAVRCYDSRGGNLTARCVDMDGAVWEDDSIEIFIAPQYKGRDYYQFIVNPLGTKYDGHGTDRSWGCGWETKVVRENNAWVILCMIPLRTVGIRSDGNTMVGFNVCRSRYANGLKESSSWSYSSGSFHNADEFGAMIIGDPNLSLHNLIKLCRERRGQMVFKSDEKQDKQSPFVRKMAAQMKLLMNEIDAKLASAEQPETNFEELKVLCSQINSLLNEYETQWRDYQNQTNTIKATMWL